MTLEDIKNEVAVLAQQINAPETLLPRYDGPDWFAHPYIELDAHGQLHYVIAERGQENERKTTAQLNELLYWIFADVSFEMACKYELNNRVENQDGRRVIFAKQEALLGILSEDWRLREQATHQAILKQNPFDDQASARAGYAKALRAQGLSETTIAQLIYEKYPKP
jgi:hypothetical protein